MEIDDKQELNFRFIANAIADLGYTGFVAHEWRPAMGNDPVKSLERCFEILERIVRAAVLLTFTLRLLLWGQPPAPQPSVQEPPEEDRSFSLRDTSSTR